MLWETYQVLNKYLIARVKQTQKGKLSLSFQNRTSMVGQLILVQWTSKGGWRKYFLRPLLFVHYTKIRYPLLLGHQKEDIHFYRFENQEVYHFVPNFHPCYYLQSFPNALNLLYSVGDIVKLSSIYCSQGHVTNQYWTSKNRQRDYFLV